MNILAKRIIASELISGSFFLFLGTTIGNILAFILNVFLVHHLSYTAYAEFSALISLVTLASIPAQGFLPTIVQFASRYFAKDDTKKAARLFSESLQKIGIIAGLIALGFILFSPWIGGFLHIPRFVEIWMVGLVVAGMYLGVINNAFLQSLLRFPFLSFSMTFSGVLKLTASIGFFFAGFGLVGILWGYFLAFFLPFLISLFPLKFLLAFPKKASETIHTKEILLYGLPATIAVFSLSSFTSTDILLVKHFFSPADSALYSGLSLIGRIIFYFTAPISAVMFPLVVKRFHRAEKFQNLLYASFLLVLLPSVGLTALYFLFPNIVISIFLGNKYLSVASYIGWFGLYLTVFSLLNVMVNFFLSLKKTQVSWVIAAGAILQTIGISLFHTSISIVIFVSLILSLVLFALLLLYYMRLYGSNKKTT